MKSNIASFLFFLLASNAVAEPTFFDDKMNPGLLKSDLLTSEPKEIRTLEKPDLIKDMPTPLPQVKPVAQKPPFTSTPVGQPLSYPANATDNVKATPTRNSPFGGYAGLTRSQGTKQHAGIDDSSKDVVNQDVIKYSGASEGLVVQSGPAYTKSGTYLGQRVTIQVVDDRGVWQSKTMHHAKVFVKKDDIVKPDDVIAEGSGKGEQFASPLAGDPHVHWEVTLNGEKVDPLTGLPLKK